MSTHYSDLNPQPIVVIEGWRLNFHLGCVIKYVARAPYKGDQTRDLLKARWYLERELQLLEAIRIGGPPPPPEPQS